MGTTGTSRRGFLGLAAAGSAAVAVWPRVSSAGVADREQDEARAAFPGQDPRRVREFVGASHGNIRLVAAEVQASPALAKAGVDWAYGDWETALGAASHVGNREIAELLISKGARPDIFTCAMMGWVDAVRGMVEGRSGVQRLHGPHGFTLMHHARVGGDRARSVVDYLQSVGGADEMYPEVTLDDGDRQVYLGSYAFGSEPDEVLEVTNDRGSLWVARVGRFGRRLVALGEHAFHPIGAEAVRIRFGVTGGRAHTLVVHDPEPIVTARRQEG